MIQMKEIWKNIYFIDNHVEHDYRGMYQISNYGRVKSLERIDKANHIIKEKFLKISNVKGYNQVTLFIGDGTRKIFKVHRLVAHMFVSGYFEGACVDHIIPIKNGGTDHYLNLRWVTNRENSNNPLTKRNISTSLKGIPKTEEHKRKQSEIMKGKKRTKESLQKQIEKQKVEVVQYYADTMEFIRVWSSIKEAQETLGINGISKCCKGKNKTCGKDNDRRKFTWRYKND